MTEDLISKHMHQRGGPVHKEWLRTLYYIRQLREKCL